MFQRFKNKFALLAIGAAGVAGVASAAAPGAQAAATAVQTQGIATITIFFAVVGAVAGLSAMVGLVKKMIKKAVS